MYKKAIQINMRDAFLFAKEIFNDFFLWLSEYDVEGSVSGVLLV
jgi:hypothetical protein